MGIVVKALLIGLSLWAVSVDAADSGRIVGRVGGEAITVETLDRGKSPEAVFVKPAIAKYFATRKALVTPTEEELQIVEANVRANMIEMAEKGNRALSDADPKFIAKFLLAGWKFNAYLFDNFGGGRLLFQQAGVEAFDATHQFLKHLESERYFEIDDPAVRDAVFAYWTRDHGAFIISDKDEIAKWRDINNLGR